MKVPSHLVVDTGPLLEYIVLRFQDLPKSSWWLRSLKSRSLPTPALRDAFLTYLHRHRGRMTTSPGVIAELHRHFLVAEKECQGDKLEFRRILWGMVCREFRELRFSEETCGLLEMDPHRLPHLGPVDLGLIEVAKRKRDGGCRDVKVLTIDTALAAECRRHQISADLVMNVVVGYHQSRA